MPAASARSAARQERSPSTTPIGRPASTRDWRMVPPRDASTPIRLTPASYPAKPLPPRVSCNRRNQVVSFRPRCPGGTFPYVLTPEVESCGQEGHAGRDRRDGRGGGGIHLLVRPVHHV